jgi:hypothetical protein
MRTEGLAKAFVAGGAIPARIIVKADSTAGQVVAADAATDKLIGISADVAAASTDRVDVFVSGIAEVIYGGNVAAGDLVTADASGYAVAAAPAATVNNRVIGTAMVAGVSGDIGSVLICPGSLQGAGTGA